MRDYKQIIAEAEAYLQRDGKLDRETLDSRMIGFLAQRVADLGQLIQKIESLVVENPQPDRTRRISRNDYAVDQRSG